MQTTQLKCPHCSSTVTFAQEIAPGATVECLICMRAFVANPAPRPVPSASASTSPAKPVAVKSPGKSVAASKARVESQAAESASGGKGALIAVALAFLVLVGGGLALAAWKIWDTQKGGVTGVPDPKGKEYAGADKTKEPAEKKSEPSENKKSNPEPVKPVDPPKPKQQPEKTPDDKENGKVPKKPMEEEKKGLIRKKEIKQEDKEPEAPPIVKVTPPPDKLLKPIPGLDAAMVNGAVDRGIAYLKRAQSADGSWPAKSHVLGYTSFCSLTLLECKTDPTDPALQRAAAYIRTHAPSSSENYDISTAILFLDRLGDPKDRPLIQNLAIRLLCSQNEDASWGYRANVPDADGAQKLLAFLQSHKQPNGKSVSDKGPIAANTLNEFLQSRVVVVNQGRAKGAHVVKGASLERSSDHSNTQFALLALWAARRHDVPTDHALLASWQRFMMIQNQDGGWAYTAPDVPGAIAAAFPTTNTMSCVGLLALALGHGISPDLQVNPKKPAERVVRPPTQDPRIELGLRSTARWVGQPLAAANVRSAKIDNLYFLWSVERVGVLYELEQINGKDWYAWGAQILVTNQTAGGDWPSVFYPGSEATANTCFALLFLKRSNLVQDLTETFRLQSGIRNP